MAIDLSISSSVKKVKEKTWHYCKHNHHHEDTVMGREQFCRASLGHYSGGMAKVLGEFTRLAFEIAKESFGKHWVDWKWAFQLVEWVHP